MWIPEYLSSSILVVGVVLLVIERLVKIFGKCNRKDEILQAIHDLRSLTMQMSSRSESLRSSNSDEVLSRLNE